jgi:predicted MFS family arabinose efflux permease
MEKDMKTELKKEFKLLKNFYIFYFLWGLASFITAYWIVYFQDVGLSFKEISIILATMFLAPIIFEVPTGAIADHFGRKVSVIIGLFFAGLLLMLITLTTSFIPLIILFFSFMSISTLISGSDAAWMVDFLKSKKQAKLTRVAFARIWSIIALSSGLSYMIASFIVSRFSMKELWIAQGALLITTSMFVMFFGDKEQVNKKSTFKGSLRSTFGFAKDGFKLILARRTLLFFILAVFFNSFVLMGEIIWQPFLIELGWKLPSLGILYGGAVIIGVLAPMLSVKLVKYLKSDKWVLILEDLVTGVLFIIVALITSPILAVVIFYLIKFGDKLRSPIKSHFLHKHIPSKIRATVSSIKSLVESLGAAIAVLLAGVVIDTWGFNVALIFVGLATIPTAICYLMIKDEK